MANFRPRGDRATNAGDAAHCQLLEHLGPMFLQVFGGSDGTDSFKYRDIDF